MPSLSQSPILQALGYAIAHSLWQMAMVWIVYVLLNSLVKFRSEIKYRIAVAAQVVGFAWFIGTLQFYYRQCSQALRMAEALYMENDQATSVVYSPGKSSLLSFFIKAEQVLPYLSVAYLLLLAFLIVRWFRAYRYTQIVRLNGLHKIDVDWKLFVNKVAGQLGIKRNVRIYLSELVKGPVTMGFLKPVILIPIASINHLTPQQLEAVILHELAHIRRHDYLLNIILSIIDLGLFFNPFTRLITKSVSKERENSCDDWVLQYQYNPSMYAEALLRIAVMQKTPAMAMYAVKTKSELASRVQRMVNQKDGRFSYRHQLIALLLMTGILTSIAWYDPNAMKPQDIKATAENQAVVLEPLAAKIDNPLFNPMFFLNDPLKEEVKKNVAASQKLHNRLRRETETAMREIRLPRVMAPVAIENLKELEKNIPSVNKEVKRTWLTTLANAKLAQGQAYLAQTQSQLQSLSASPVFHFDTLRFSNAYGFNANGDGNWYSFAEDLKATQKSIEDAFKKGRISQAEAKKMNESSWYTFAEDVKASQKAIEDAFKKGKLSQAEMKKAQAEIASLFKAKMPQFYSFATGNGGAQVFFGGDDVIDEKRERIKEDKSKTEGKDKIAYRRVSHAYADSIRQRLMARATTTPPAPFHGFATAEGTAPFMVIDNDRAVLSTFVQGTQTKEIARKPLATTTLRGTPREKTLRNDVVTTYTYTSPDMETIDECDKANNSRRVKKVTVAGGSVTTKGKPLTGSCTKVVVKSGANADAAPPSRPTAPVVIEFEVQ